jgi:Protein of unknown function (DUF5672)
VKLRLHNTTLCVADTLNCRLTAKAAQHSAEVCQFSKYILLSDHEWDDLPGFDFSRIPEFKSSLDYNQRINSHLFERIDTEYVLLVQWDGFIIDPSSWLDIFFEYDYIGAPWPQFSEHAVGNGGFSLRSRRLLAALHADALIPGDEPEDICIGRCWRPQLESRYGITFPDRTNARNFSLESELSARYFGFHGLYHLNLYYHGSNFDTLMEHIDPNVLSGWRVLVLAANYLRSRHSQEGEELLRRILLTRPVEEVAHLALKLRLPDLAIEAVKLAR